jgi:hypothetical protein
MYFCVSPAAKLHIAYVVPRFFFFAFFFLNKLVIDSGGLGDFNSHGYDVTVHGFAMAAIEETNY